MGTPYGVRDDMPPFESLDWVFDELYDERWSDKKLVGVREGLDVSGVRGLPLADGGSECVSRASEEPLTRSFLDDELGKRKTDFQGLDDAGARDE